MIFPPIPSWDGLHPLIVHFPIVLTLFAPLFALAAALSIKRRTTLAVAAWLLLALGTASAFVSVSTGEAAGELAERNTSIEAVLEQHESLAETARIVLAALTVVYGAVLIFPRFKKTDWQPRTGMIVNLVATLAMIGGATVVANTAHQGGRLVHEFGVRALVAPSNAPAGAVASGTPGQLEKESVDDAD